MASPSSLRGLPPPALAGKKATSTTPIIFTVGTDPVQAGLVASLNRPGGNATGTTDLLIELFPKRLELLHEIAPGAISIGYLYYHSPSGSAVDEPSIMAVETAARILGVRLVTEEAGTASEIERAFAMFVGERIGALLIGPTSLLVDVARSHCVSRPLCSPRYVPR